MKIYSYYLKNRTIFHRYFMTLFLPVVFYTDSGDEMKLSEVREGESARVVRISLKMKDQKRLFYIGLYEGVYIQKLKQAPMKDPCLYFVSGNQIILRNQDADHIEVEVK